MRGFCLISVWSSHIFREREQIILLEVAAIKQIIQYHLWYVDVIKLNLFNNIMKNKYESNVKENLEVRDPDCFNRAE